MINELFHLQNLELQIPLFTGFFSYERIGNSYILKLNEKLSYNDGQEACHKLHGNILEFDERYDYEAKLKAIKG